MGNENQYEYKKKWESQENYMGQEYFEYYVIYSHNRDSDLINESNWETLIKLLDDNKHEYSIEHFRHWACGWVEIIIVHESETQTLEFCNEIIESIKEKYPILDESDYSEKEQNAFNDGWNNWSESDYINAIESKFDIEINIKDKKQEFKQVFDDIASSINEYWITESNSCYIDVDKIVKATELNNIIEYLTPDSLKELNTICQKCNETFDKLHNDYLCDNCYKPNNDSGLNHTLNIF